MPTFSLLPQLLREPAARWWRRFEEAPALAAALDELSAETLDELLRVVAASEFAATTLIRDPTALSWLVEFDTPPRIAEWAASYERRVAAAPSTASAQQLLREWRRRAMLRIVWRDVTGRATVRETLGSLSELADGCLRAASAAAQFHLSATFGTPRNAAGDEATFIVVAMGKLGGRELNFSSDIDLIFLYSEGGETDNRSTDNSEFFNRLGREVIRLLDAPTEDGFVFRVDMRLRPLATVVRWW